MVKLYNSGKPVVEIVKEYDLTRSAFIETKIKIIIANKEKYSISAMCKLLGVTRSLVLYRGIKK